MIDYRQHLNSERGKQKLLSDQKKWHETMMDSTNAQIAFLTEARQTVNNVMLATQISLSSFIEEVVTLALKTVFGSEYGFKVQYEVKRNKSEAYLYISKNNELFNAEDSCGGGIIDVASFGLRAALFALADPKPEPVLILDEPGKYISRGTCISQFGKMLKEVSDLLKIQIIMVSHDQSLIETADRAFQVTQTNGISEVTIIQSPGS